MRNGMGSWEQAGQIQLANLLLLCSNPEIAVFAENVELDRRFKENYTRNMKCIQAVETSTTQENSDLVEVTAKRTVRHRSLFL